MDCLFLSVLFIVALVNHFFVDDILMVIGHKPFYFSIYILIKIIAGYYSQYKNENE